MSTLSGQPRSDGRYLIRTGAKAWRAHENQLLALAPVSPVTALPLCGPALRGLVSTERGPLVYLDVGTHPTDQAPYMALVDSPCGPVALGVTQVRPLPADPDSLPSDALDSLLNTLTEGLCALPAACTDSQLQDRGPLAVRERWLLLRGTDFEVAIRARRVLQIERCPPVRSVLGLEGLHGVVHSHGQLLPARSLESLLQRPPADTASWCLHVTTATGPQALLVQALGEWIDVDASQCRTLVEGAQTSLWLLRPGQSPLQTVFESPEPDSVHDTGAPPVTASEGVQSSTCVALRAGSSPFAVVIPQSLLGPVMTAPDRFEPRRRHRQDLRVWSLDRLLGHPAAAVPTHALTVSLAGHRVMLLCGTPQALATLAAFAPVPALPVVLAGLLQGVHLREDCADLLLSTEPSRHALRALLRRHLRQARLGWLPLHPISPETTTDHAS